MRLTICTVVLAMFCGAVVPPSAMGQGMGNEMSPDNQPPKEFAAIREIDKRHKKQYADNQDVLVLPGLVADRKKQKVTIWSIATGLGAEDPVEFWLIPHTSGKTHETVAISAASPADVHKAMKFIGLKPGRPVHFGKDQYWPRGQRIKVKYNWLQSSKNPGEEPQKMSVRAEELIFDVRANKPMPSKGLLFTGSRMVERPGQNDVPPEKREKVLLASVDDSQSIISNYNDPGTLIDVPNQHPQGAVYGSLMPNPKYRFDPNQLVTVSIEPLPGKSEPGIDVDIFAKDGLNVVLTREGEEPQNLGVLKMIEYLAEQAKKHDIYVTAAVSDEFTALQARLFFELLRGMEGPDSIRLEAKAGELYHAAYFPDENWRDRSKRLGDTIEVHFSRDEEGKLSAEVVNVNLTFENGKQVFKTKKASADSPEKLLETMKEFKGRWTAASLVYSIHDLNMGEVRKWIGPSLKEFPRTYLFPPTKAADANGAGK